MEYNTNGFAIIFYTIFSIVNCGVYICMSQWVIDDEAFVNKISKITSLILLDVILSILLFISFIYIFACDFNRFVFLHRHCNTLMFMIAVIYNYLVTSLNMIELRCYSINFIIASNAMLCFSNIVLYVSCCIIEHCIYSLFFDNVVTNVDDTLPPPCYDDIIYHI